MRAITTLRFNSRLSALQILTPIPILFLPRIPHPPSHHFSITAPPYLLHRLVPHQPPTNPPTTHPLCLKTTSFDFDIEPVPFQLITFAAYPPPLHKQHHSVPRNGQARHNRRHKSLRDLHVLLPRAQDRLYPARRRHYLR
ncbi:unnamed protein product [Chondrus crispus]|uniref:Uncharacterized protein n=1 Tax=Chondrus crispus TaxID=2769 RepID=R7QBV9_CHOCR|nr:unnamed protein product [Chondrus crispus]CDF35283.1 unnamed protein product [Chondrus crispus]|eukprot:XP_005715102.1 unnamed protein product [Chondrus crispus]